MKQVVLFLFLMFFVACGYRPTINVANETLKGNVYIDIPIDIQNIKNSIVIHEAFIDIFSNKFNMNIVNQKHKADLFVTGKLLSVTETQLESVDGYSSSYRETIRLKLSYYGKNTSKKSFEVSDFYDFNVDDDSIVSQNKKDEAIEIAIRNALLLIPSKVVISDMK